MTTIRAKWPTPYSGRKKKDQLRDRKERKELDAELAAEKDAKEEQKRFQAAEALARRNLSLLTGNPEAALDDETHNDEDMEESAELGTYSISAISSTSDDHNLGTEFERESDAEIERRKDEAVIPVNELSAEQLTSRGGVLVDVSIFAGWTDSSPSVVPFPTRPETDTTDVHELNREEQSYFDTWLNQVKENHGRSNLNNFEHNLHVWQQLWRVIERSDVLLVLVDVRHPAHNFPVALYRHLDEDVGKPVVLVLNKVDLVPCDVVLAWKRAFEHHFPSLVVTWFSSYPRPGTTTNEAVEAETKQKQIDRKRKWRASGVKRLLRVCREAGLNVQEGETLTIGTLGQPNTGKSSLINGLMGRKVVSASRQPGHTKHFQTMQVTKDVVLCDCPGLVFPAIDISRAEQVLLGSFPVNQLREPFSSLRFVAEKMHLHKVYSLDLAKVAVNGEQEWSPFLLAAAYAERRNYHMAHSGVPDVWRAASEMLWDVVDGRVLLHFVPNQFFEQDEADNDGWLLESDGTNDDDDQDAAAIDEFLNTFSQGDDDDDDDDDGRVQSAFDLLAEFGSEDA